MSRRAFAPVKPRTIGTVEKCLADLIEQAGGVQRVMIDLGLGQSTVYGFTESKPEVPMSFARVAAVTRPGVTAGAEYLSLLAGGVFLPIDGDTAGMSELCAADVRAHGEAIGCLVEALKDGRLTETEKRATRAKLLAALRTLLGLLALVAKGDQLPG